MTEATDKSMFTRQVEPGRLILINYGQYAGKTASIVDMIDLRRIVVDGPETNVPRHVIPIKWINLTDFRTVIARGTRQKFLKKQNQKDQIYAKWSRCEWAKKIERKQIKKNLTDLDRFNLLVARKEKSKIVKKAVKAQNKGKGKKK